MLLQKICPFFLGSYAIPIYTKLGFKLDTIPNIKLIIIRFVRLMDFENLMKIMRKAKVNLFKKNHHYQNKNQQRKHFLILIIIRLL